jgi:hypothetical protein
MNATMKKSAIAATMAIAFAIMSVAMPGNASARDGRHSSRPVASPPPSFGYFGSFPIILDYAQAQALSLRRPYYSHFMYDYCDYRNCVLHRRSVVNPDGSRVLRWVPVWYGPPS